MVEVFAYYKADGEVYCVEFKCHVADYLTALICAAKKLRAEFGIDVDVNKVSAVVY